MTKCFQAIEPLRGFGADANILVASVHAYLQALNELRSFEAKRASSRFGSVVASKL